MLKKFRVGSAGKWKASFHTAEEAVAEAQRLATDSDFVVFVVRRGFFTPEFVAAFLAEMEPLAREVWEKSSNLWTTSLGGHGGGGV